MLYFSASFLLGIILFLPYLILAHRLVLNRAVQFLSSGLVVAALIYVGLAVWRDTAWMGVETVGVIAYGMCAILAIRHSILWLSLGWGLHPLWDVALHWLGPGSHVVPAWYAIACVSFDLAVAGYVGWLWQSGKPPSAEPG